MKLLSTDHLLSLLKLGANPIPELKEAQAVPVANTTEESLPFQDLGYANGWGQTPAVLENCSHSCKSRKIGNCKWEYSCDTCKFVYRVDSGD